MLRLIWPIVLVVAVVLAFIAVQRTVQALSSDAANDQGNQMPATFQKFAYVLLVILMVGVTTGWLGAG